MLREAGPDDLIVTADDDIFYGRDWLSGLLAAYEDSSGKPVAELSIPEKTLVAYELA